MIKNETRDKAAREFAKLSAGDPQIVAEIAYAHGWEAALDNLADQVNEEFKDGLRIAIHDAFCLNGANCREDKSTYPGASTRSLNAIQRYIKAWLRS